MNNTEKNFYRVLIYMREGRNGPIDPLERFIVSSCDEFGLRRAMEANYFGMCVRVQPVETFEVVEVAPPAPLSPPAPAKVLEPPEELTKKTSSTWLKKCSLNDEAYPELHPLMEKYKNLQNDCKEAHAAILAKAKEIEAARPCVVSVSMSEATINPWRGEVEDIALALEGGYIEELRGSADKEKQA